MSIRVYIVRELIAPDKNAARVVPRRDGEVAPIGGQLVATCEDESEYEAVAREVAAMIPSDVQLASRPSLQSMAEAHARLRWPKKKRNADLRANGYDPDGSDGADYRRFLRKAMDENV